MKKFFILLGILLIIIVALVLYRKAVVPTYGGLTEDQLRSEEFQKGVRLGSDAARVDNVKSILVPIHIYFSDHRKYPQSLNELIPNYLPSTYTDKLKEDNYLYAVSTNGMKFHLGIALQYSQGFSGNPALASDADFNSKLAGYANGFNGVDPIFDLTETSN